MCGAPVSLLVIEGEVEAAVLQEAWEGILSEYSTLIHTEKATSVFEAYKRMVGAKWKMEFMDLALRALRVHYEAGLGHSEAIAEKILLLGYNYIQDTPDPDDYLAQIDAVEMECRSLVVFFNQYKAEYEAIAPKGEKTPEERDRMSYLKELRLLSQNQGYPINPEAITVLEYASYVNFYLESHKKDN